MPMRMAPRTLSASSAAMSRKAATATPTCGVLRSPSLTSVVGSEAMRPAACSPMNAKKNPIPTEMASFIDLEMELITHSRTGVTLTRKKRTPDRNTAPSAVCQVTPRPFTTE